MKSLHRLKHAVTPLHFGKAFSRAWNPFQFDFRIIRSCQLNNASQLQYTDCFAYRLSFFFICHACHFFLIICYATCSRVGKLLRVDRVHHCQLGTRKTGRWKMLGLASIKLFTQAYLMSSLYE